MKRKPAKVVENGLIDGVATDMNPDDGMLDMVFYAEHCPKCDSEALKKGAKNATINRDLSDLRRMLNLGAKQTPRR